MISLTVEGIVIGVCHGYRVLGTMEKRYDDIEALLLHKGQCENLLVQHHDFFLATQHPAASPAIRNLAIKYAMPSRM